MPTHNDDVKGSRATDAPLAVARSCVAAGLSVLPVSRDGSKQPDWRQLPLSDQPDPDTGKRHAAWKPLQSRLPTDAELVRWFGGAAPCGIGVIGGAVSGNLETLDFDREAPTLFPAWRDLVEAERPGLTERLCVSRTPKPGFHIRYRAAGVPVPGNTKLASDADAPGDDRVLIETRGEGGYALAPGSPAECHETGRLYEHHTGPALPDVPTVGADEREVLVRCARSFDRPAAPGTGGTRATPGPLKPGEDFDRRGPDWAELLTRHGWELARQQGGKRYWRRPGKDGKGWSATTGHCTGKDGADLLHVFTSNAAPFADGESYGKFRTFALLNHGGDLSAAARELARQGYGARGPAGGGQGGGAPAGADGDGAAVIRGYLIERYDPDFRRGNVIHCADGREVGMPEACAVPTSALIDQLAIASDAPTYKGGGVNRGALPGFFAKWAKVAWGDLLAELPDEDAAELGDGSEARAQFRDLVRDAMLSEVTLNNTVRGVTLTERRSLIDWCHRFARAGPWRTVRSKRCWCKLREDGGGELVLGVAVRQDLFAQLRADRRLCALGENTFARRCDRYGVGTSSRADRPHGLSAVVLSDDFLAPLTAGLSAGDDADADDALER
jgi:putative DNA primase/helicase